MDNEVPLLSFQDLEKSCNEAFGVTPLELYMRQNGLCYLTTVSGVVYCTDGVDEFRFDELCNPTVECVRCVHSMMSRLVDNEAQ
jgi:hypothetical protein